MCCCSNVDGSSQRWLVRVDGAFGKVEQYVICANIDLESGTVSDASKIWVRGCWDTNLHCLAGEANQAVFDINQVDFHKRANGRLDFRLIYARNSQMTQHSHGYRILFQDLGESVPTEILDPHEPFCKSMIPPHISDTGQTVPRASFVSMRKVQALFHQTALQTPSGARPLSVMEEIFGIERCVAGGVSSPLRLAMASPPPASPKRASNADAGSPGWQPRSQSVDGSFSLDSGSPAPTPGTQGAPSGATQLRGWLITQFHEAEVTLLRLADPADERFLRIETCVNHGPSQCCLRYHCIRCCQRCGRICSCSTL
eukprot:gnl/Spiro4/22679_TR11191_c0_g2_i1.p1 gnl/Spiro4/22679_TR11191_c0_g2~~gnl/Spiro4/22679_TR11191_c0_g2_i1.p1  ORF type:complete len:313 (+),score=66.66 gnl/Spiro4/22679_TR11191_c0_g2_i1:66-1004(+)